MSNKQNDIFREGKQEKDSETWEDGYSFGIYKAREIIDELRESLLKETTIGGHTIKIFDEIAKKIWLNKP